MNRITTGAICLVILGLFVYSAVEFVMHARWWVTILVILALVSLAIYRERPRYRDVL